jgi:hypothetical protein
LLARLDLVAVAQKAMKLSPWHPGMLQTLPQQFLEHFLDAAAEGVPFAAWIFLRQVKCSIRATGSILQFDVRANTA